MISDIYNLNAITKIIAPEEKSSGATYQRLRYAMKGHIDLVSLEDLLKLHDVLSEHSRISLSQLKKTIQEKRRKIKKSA